MMKIMAKHDKKMEFTKREKIMDHKKHFVPVCQNGISGS